MGHSQKYFFHENSILSKTLKFSASKITQYIPFLSLSPISVEGRGDAIILDVIYETKEEEDSEIEVKREEGNGLKKELIEKKKELAALEFQQSLIERQKNILNEFASHVTGGGWDKKVSYCVVTISCTCTFKIPLVIIFNIYYYF